MSYVRISRRAAQWLERIASRALEDIWPRIVDDDRALAELKLALEPKKKRGPTDKVKRRQKRDASNAEVYRAVASRCGGYCECGCGRLLLHNGGLTPELDHFWGRANAWPSEVNCWMLARVCHQLKTNHSPHADHWLERFAAHCRRHSYHTEASRADRAATYAKTKRTISGGPRPSREQGGGSSL